MSAFACQYQLIDKENETLRLEVIVAEQAMFAVMGKLMKKQKTCNHVFVPWRPLDPKDKWDSVSGHCELCGLDGGWYCPESKSGKCCYKLGNYHHPNCIHCHMPSERK